MFDVLETCRQHSFHSLTGDADLFIPPLVILPTAGVKIKYKGLTVRSFWVVALCQCGVALPNIKNTHSEWVFSCLRIAYSCRLYLPAKLCIHWRAWSFFFRMLFSWQINWALMWDCSAVRAQKQFYLMGGGGIKCVPGNNTNETKQL